MALHVTGELGSIKRSRLLLIRSSAPPGGGTPRPCLATPGGAPAGCHPLQPAFPCSQQNHLHPCRRDIPRPFPLPPTKYSAHPGSISGTPFKAGASLRALQDSRGKILQEKPGGAKRRGEELQPPLGFLRARALPWPGRMCRGRKARVGLPRNRRCDS